MDNKKYLDQEGLKFLWSKISMKDYPNNETLIAVLNAIDETKADKEQLPPDTNEPQKQLVTNENGEKVWENKLAYTQPEEVICLTKEVTKGKIEMFAAVIALQAGECIIEYNNKTYTAVAENLESVAVLQFNSSDNFPGYSPIFITPPNIFINENRTWPGESGTLTIKQVQNVVHKMDAKYLPISIRSELGRDDLILGDTMGQRMNEFTPGIASLTHQCSEASGPYAAAFNHSKAQGFNSFSANYGTAAGDCSAAFGNATAKGKTQFALGEHNILDENDEYFFIIGNGSRTLNEDQTALIEKFSNAATISRQGEAWFSGDVYVGSTSGTNRDDGSKKLATEEYVDTKINKFKNTPFIEGTGVTDETNKISTWIGNSDEITEYYDGLTIKYKIGVEGQSTVTLDINGLGAKTVYRFSTTKLTTQFPVGSIINLIYHADLNDGCWITNDYDANTNTQQRVYESSAKNVEYPITARYATTSGSNYYAEYGRYSTGVTLNPSKNTITATTFNGNLNGTATKAIQDSHGNVIVDTYATKNYVQQEFASKALTLTGLDAEGISHTWTIYGVAQ